MGIGWRSGAILFGTIILCAGIAMAIAQEKSETQTAKPGQAWTIHDEKRPKPAGKEHSDLKRLATFGGAKKKCMRAERGERNMYATEWKRKNLNGRNFGSIKSAVKELLYEGHSGG